jgi:hypothetical protein
MGQLLIPTVRGLEAFARYMRRYLNIQSSGGR